MSNRPAAWAAGVIIKDPARRRAPRYLDFIAFTNVRRGFRALCPVHASNLQAQQARRAGKMQPPTLGFSRYVLFPIYPSSVLCIGGRKPACAFLYRWNASGTAVPAATIWLSVASPETLKMPRPCLSIGLVGTTLPFRTFPIAKVLP